MPGGDGTGPNGMGPMTGRVAGYCAGYVTPGYVNPGFGYGYGRGRGGGGRGWRNRYYATGLPGWQRAMPGVPYAAPYGAAPGAPVAPAMTPDQQVDALKAQAEYFEGALNDIRTLRSKVDMFSRNSMKVARFLETRREVEKVDYLGLESHQLHELASRYMFLVDAENDPQYGTPVNRYGHLLSFRVKGGAAPTRKMFDALRRVWRATDLGRIKSVATIPAISTHQQQGQEAREMSDIPPNMVRLCVGGEHPDDVIADLSQACDAIKGDFTAQVPRSFSYGGASDSCIAPKSGKTR